MCQRALRCLQCRRRQVWDLNKPAPAEVGRDYHVVLASNVLHTAANMASALPLLTAHLCDPSLEKQVAVSTEAQ